jgi:transposase
MPKKRLSMRKVKEVLRLKSLGLSNRQIAQSTKVSHSTVADYLSKAEKADLTWPIVEELDDAAIETMLFGKDEKKPRMVEPNYDYIYKELKKDKVTLMLLWEEYIEAHPDGYRYSQFCRLYRQWSGHIDPCMRFNHKAGEKCFVDYAGMTMPVVDKNTGEIKQAQIFVATLGASSYTYAEATWTQELHNFIASHIRAFEFFGGVTQVLVPDNLKSGVTKASLYDPDINPTYHDFATHYSVAVIPARPSKPKDKPKVESAVNVVEMWILAYLRNRVFFSLSELNEAIKERLGVLNSRPFQKLEGSRKQVFKELDKPVLRPLPLKQYEFAAWKKATVNIDYHIEVNMSYYSVPYKLVKKKVDVRITANTVEILFGGKRVASHIRTYKKGVFSTIFEHMPKAHQKYFQTPSIIVDWAKKCGKSALELVEAITKSKPHPEQGYRECLGIMRLANRYGNERVEAACKRALSVGAIRYKSVRSILEKGLDKAPLEEITTSAITHENIRGKSYYGG